MGLLSPVIKTTSCNCYYYLLIKGEKRESSFTFIPFFYKRETKKVRRTITGVNSNGSLLDVMLVVIEGNVIRSFCYDISTIRYLFTLPLPDSLSLFLCYYSGRVKVEVVQKISNGDITVIV